MSRNEKLRAALRDGERFVVLPKQGLPLVLPAPPSCDEIVAGGGTCANTTEKLGFLTHEGTLATSPSAACKLILNRNGQTNEWNGPRHLFVERDGIWTSYKKLTS
jgi:hypothetical protein